MTRSPFIVGVVGAGTMGAGIAQVAATAGHRTFVFDAEPGRAAAACDEVSAALDRLVGRGRIAAAEAKAIRDRMAPVGSLGDLSSCGLVVEAIVESVDAKRALFRELAGVVGPDAILATNTSSISIDVLAHELPAPGRLVGLHFFNPAPVMRLVEVVTGSATDPGIVDRVHALAETWGKVAVRVASTPGFVVNRIARPFYAEAQRVLEEGATDAATIDAVMREAGGFRMGPLEVTDLVGQDVSLAVSRSVWEATGYDPRYAPSARQRALVESGRLGRKTGHGIYSYARDAERPEPTTAAPCPAPDRVRTGPRIGPLADLVDRARKAGIVVEDMAEGIEPPGELDFQNATARLGGGLTATGRRVGKPVVMLDLALDYRTATRLAVAPPVGCPPAALGEVVGFLQATGMAVSVIEDTPGLILTRTVVRLVNEAADLVGRGIASAEDVDLAMRYGANYPIGPLEWGDRVGVGPVCEILDDLEDYYRDGRYRPSPFLRRHAASGRPLSQLAGAQADGGATNG